MTYLLDTNVCMAAMRGHPLVLEYLRAILPADCGISTISIYEIYLAIAGCQRPDIKHETVENLIGAVNVLPFDPDAVKETARIRHELEQRGETVGLCDIMIAGQALSLGMTVVTQNTVEFQKIPGLLVQDWKYNPQVPD